MGRVAVTVGCLRWKLVLLLKTLPWLPDGLRTRTLLYVHADWGSE